MKIGKYRSAKFALIEFSGQSMFVFLLSYYFKFCILKLVPTPFTVKLITQNCLLCFSSWCTEQSLVLNWVKFEIKKNWHPVPTRLRAEPSTWNAHFVIRRKDCQMFAPIKISVPRFCKRIFLILASSEF